MLRTLARSLLAIAAMTVSAPAAGADPISLVGQLRGLPPAFLVGSFGGGHSGGRGPRGFFFGADTGWAWLVGGTDIATRSTTGTQDSAWCFGAKAGYQLRSGLAVQVRYDHLGVTAPDASGNLSFATVGVRYALPMVIEPFAEAMAGPAFHGSDVSLGAGLGGGLAVIATRHVVFDAAVRDWLVDIRGVHHAPTVTLGITAGFGG